MSEERTVEKYRLTLTHSLIIDNHTVEIEPAKTMKLLNCSQDKTVIDYREQILQELFHRFLSQVMKESKDAN